MLWVGDGDSGGSSANGNQLKLVILNRKPESKRSMFRQIVQAKELAATLRSHELVASVDVASPDASWSLKRQLQSYAQADVVIAVHGAGMYAVPAMRKGSLLIEVFHEGQSGTSLSYFYNLAAPCGVVRCVRIKSVDWNPCMTDNYLRCECAHYELYPTHP